MFHGGGPSKLALLAVGAFPVHYFICHVLPTYSGTSQVWTGSLLCMCSQYSRNISASAAGRAETAVLQRPHSGDLPAGAVTSGARPPFDHAEQPIADLGGDAPAVQARRRPSAAVRRAPTSSALTVSQPGQNRSACMPWRAASIEITLRCSEFHLGPDLAFLFGQRAQHAVVEGGVGQHVDRRSARRAAPGFRPADAAGPLRRRTPADSSGTPCRCAAAARPGAGSRPASSSATGSSSDTSGSSDGK